MNRFESKIGLFFQDRVKCAHTKYNLLIRGDSVMMKADFGKAVAGLMLGASVLATSVSAADLTLGEYSKLSGEDRAKFVTDTTVSYAEELLKDRASLDKAECIAGNSRQDRVEKFKVVSATMNHYASLKPDYPADAVVKKTFDKLCAPKALALR